ncbi:MAG: hypothetical protein ACK5KR_00780 [Breznakia sp.]
MEEKHLVFINSKNFKKGQYILNKYRKKDLFFILLIVVISVFLVAVYLNIFIQNNIILDAIIVSLLLLPIGIAFILYLPMPTYFNVLDFLKVTFLWLFKSKKWEWIGIYKGEDKELE